LIIVVLPPSSLQTGIYYQRPQALMQRPGCERLHRAAAAGAIEAGAVNVTDEPESKKWGLDRGYSAHSMRATFITATLENVPSSMTCTRRPPIVTRARRTSMIGAAAKCARRFDFADSPKLPMLAAQPHDSLGDAGTNGNAVSNPRIRA
jgi:hypothetical protein